MQICLFYALAQAFVNDITAQNVGTDSTPVPDITQTTPVPQEEEVPFAFWKKVNKQLWKRNNEDRLRFLQTTPRPTLDPWRDHQPYFTWLGDTVLKDISSIRTPPTATPPPNQQGVNNVLIGECPELIIPRKIRVEVPACNAAVGHWLDPFKRLSPMLAVQSTGCSDISLFEPLGPNTTQDMKLNRNSVLLGSMHEEFTFGGSTYDFLDCNGNTAFKITELIIRQGVEDPQRQESQQSYVENPFGLPHRTKVFLKYSISEPNGNIFAETNVFPVGEDGFWWHMGNYTGHVAPRSAAVASSTRVGFWNPRQCGNWTKAWSVKFNDTKIHNNTLPQVHFRLAITAAMTVLAWRDEQRSEDGLVRAYEGCAVESAVVFWVLFFFALFVPIAIFLYIWIKGAREAREFCFDLESWLLPHLNAKPSKSRKY